MAAWRYAPRAWTCQLGAYLLWPFILIGWMTGASPCKVPSYSPPMARLIPADLGSMLVLVPLALTTLAVVTLLLALLVWFARVPLAVFGAWVAAEPDHRQDQPVEPR
jgi:hypothetical protein